jgi:hypothetical protein
VKLLSPQQIMVMQELSGIGKEKPDFMEEEPTEMSKVKGKELMKWGTKKKWKGTCCLTMMS